MADYTENYNLRKPADINFYNVQDFNNNADIIDTALNNKLNKDFSNISSGAVPIANGGTDATTAANALNTLKALPLSGGTLTGDLRLKPTGSNYGAKINFGDSDYAYLKENTDDSLEIKANGINFAVTDGYDKLTISTNPDPTTNQKKNIFTNDGHINPDLTKNYGLLGDNGVLYNQNILSYVDSLPENQCGTFAVVGCTGAPDSNDWWYMSLSANGNQKTLFAHGYNSSQKRHVTWIRQRWGINGVNTWLSWKRISV